MSKAVKAAVIVAGIATGVGILTGAIAGGSAFTAFGASLFSAGTVGAFFARQFVTSLVLGALSSALTKNPSGGIGGTTVTSRSSVAPRQVIYGRTRVGGTIVYMEGTESNKYLHSVIVFSGHEIDGFEKLYFNDEELIVDSPSGNVTTGKYANKVKIALVNGTSSQAAFADLVAASDGKWTANHRLLGCSAMYVRLEYDQDVFTSGVPNISVVLRGKKVYDPRTGLTTWSQNPALCLNDYLTNADYGLGCLASEVNTSALITAANICDEDVPLAAGGTENTYEINGAFQTSAAPEQIINSILSSMIGKAIWSGGKWRILAGAYYTPTLAFDEGDMRGGIRVQTNVSRRENFNSIKGTHISVEENYIPTDFPAVIGDGTTNATMANYVAQDNGEVVYKTILLPFTTSATMAQRISKIELERARQQITVSLPLKLVGLKANVGDVILLDNDRMGWVQKPFEVVSMGVTYTEEIGVDLELRETAAEVFDWNSGIDQKDYDPAPNTNLPNPFSVTPPTNLVVTATSQVNNDGTIQPLFQVTWTASLDQSVVNYEIQWKRGAYGSLPAETEFNSALLAGVSYTISGVITAASYEIRVRSISSVGVRSEWLSTLDISNSGDTTPPSAPTGLTITSDGYRSCYLKWVNPTDEDYFQTIIYASFTNDASTAGEVGRLSGTSQTYSGLLDNTTYYVWLKAVDYSGNISGFNTGVNAGTLFTTSDLIGGLEGYSYYQASVFIRSASSPAAPTGGSFDFGTNVLTAPTGWSSAPIDGTDPLWVVSYLFETQGDTGIDTATTWSTPVKSYYIPQIGVDYVNGQSVYTAVIYKLASSTPATPSGGSYDFGSNLLTPPSGWASIMPSNDASGGKVYRSEAQATVSGATGIDTTLNWSTPVLMVQNGVDGVDGDDGSTGPRNALVYFFYNNPQVSAPSAPTTAQVSYNFSTNTPSITASGWSATFSPIALSNDNTGANKYYAVKVVFQETSYGGGYTETISSVFTWLNFDGLVTFTNLANGTNENGGASTTLIDGGSIQTGTITVDKITAGTSTIASNIIFGLGSNYTVNGYKSAGYFNSTTALNSNYKFGLIATSTYGTALAAASASTTYAGAFYSSTSTAYTGAYTIANLAARNLAARFENYNPATDIFVEVANNSYGVQLFGSAVGAFTGAHDGLILKTSAQPELGDIIVDVGVYAKPNINDAICVNSVSTTANQKGVVGVVSQFADENHVPSALAKHIVDENNNKIAIVDEVYSDIDNYNIVIFNAVGEGLLNVCGQGGDIEVGDLIVTSNIAGKGMKQADDIIRGVTVAKSRENVAFSEPNEVKQIACIYISG